jgi:micrococcal nuclease
MKFKNIFFIAIIFIAIQSYITLAKAENIWSGVVTYVTDGDTLWVRPLTARTGKSASSEPRKIRIDGIDAPESCQLYGAQSTAALKKLVASKTVIVKSKRVDDYGREVAKIMVKNSDGNMDVGAWMVSNGHAWSYHYRHSAGPYRLEEETATRSHLGLFADTAAIEPRFFRREHGSCQLQKSSNGANVSQPHRKRYN